MRRATAQNGWLLAPGTVIECIDNFEKCISDETGEFSQHYRQNDIFFVEENEAIDLYLMWWLDKPFLGKNNFRQLHDVSITTGVIDQFIVGDYISIGKSGPFSGNGRYIHGTCKDPRQRGKARIEIETN